MLYLTFIDDDENDNESDDEDEDVKGNKVVKKEISQSLNNFYPACVYLILHPLRPLWSYGRQFRYHSMPLYRL